MKSASTLLHRLARVTRLVGVLTVSFVQACTGNAQRGTEIPSKADAAQMFALTRQQWRANLSATVRAGYGTRVGDALTLRTTDGAVTTLPVYSDTDGRPSRLEVTVEMPSDHVAAGDEDMFTLLIRDVRKQMGPEYIVKGRAERTQGAGSSSSLPCRRSREDVRRSTSEHS
jgi:hypothetical protein